ncbi:catabolite repressor/activator [Archangium violaceum]|uniref:catabolite repressor/activator n=1 Tax=Archangium violaceum TaxID=83451 RepID=UPI00194FA4D2|nr:catabolite repressor/activator [Archangium violaceum]QRN94215.1 catabolite repressor/activator [Archangium violaceum]
MTLADIARLAGVSRTTASYVLNGQAEERRISATTVQRVLAVAERHNFRIDAQAAALRRGASRTLGLIVPDLENTSYARLAKLLEHGARREGYQLLIVGSEDDERTERELALMLRARRCDALIVASALPAGDPFYAELMAAGTPVIAVDRALDPRRFVCVMSDNTVAAEALTRSVLDEHTRSVAWFDAVATLSITIERREGFRRAVAGRLERVHEATGARYDRESGARLMRELLSAHGLPDALVTSSYTLLQGVLDVLLELPSGLPRTLRLATFGDERLLDFLPLRVNSIPQRHERIAELTLARAMEAIQGRYEPGCEVVARELKRRS